MRKVFISIFDCKPGMETAETIYNDYGGAILSINTILDEHLIKKLIKLNIIKIRIFAHNDKVISFNSNELFKSEYNENVEIVKDILHDISIGKNVDMKKTNVVSETIYNRINENRDIVGSICDIRNTNEYTYTHSVNVSLLSMLIAKWLNLDQQTIKLIIQAGLLHDIGKIKVSKEILNKPDKLTKEEFEEMKKHSLYGFRMLENIAGISKEVCKGVLFHHEREDGSGYPLGIKGSNIHLFGKIIAVADIYDAMTSNTIYRQRNSPFEVFNLMQNETFGILDSKVVEAFLSNIAAYYIGDFVKLNNEEIAEIVYINSRDISQPIIKIKNKFIDLSQNTSIKITGMA